jgi:tellurite resistance protein TerC
MFFKTARQVVIAVAGSAVLFIGILMILLPGPAILVIPAGLAILAIEFAWAGRLLKRMKQQARSMFKSGGDRKAVEAPTAKTDTPTPVASR